MTVSLHNNDNANILRWFTLIFILVLMGNLKAQNTSVNAKQFPTLVNEPVFKPGEYAKYEVYYNWKRVWIKAGYIELSVDTTTINNQGVYHLKAVGKTRKGFNWLFKVHDIYESYIDTSTLYPIKFVRNVSEGKFKIDHIYHFNKGQVVSKTSNMHKPFKTDTFNYNTQIHDLVSAIYYTRCWDYQNAAMGTTFNIQFFIDNELFNVGTIYMGKQQVETKFGVLNCVKAQPMLLKGRVFNDTDGMQLFVTDDNNRLPVFIESPLSVGSVKAVLKEYNGLKYHMDCLAKITSKKLKRQIKKGKM